MLLVKTHCRIITIAVIIASLTLLTLFILTHTPHTKASTTDLNGYTAQYECRAGNPNCNVDVVAYTTHACDQTITTTDSAATIDSKLNGSSQYICITPGDYTSKGILTLTTSGTPSAYKVLRYTRPNDTDDEAWNQTSGNQAKIFDINVISNYWIIHRMTFPERTSGTEPRIWIQGHHIIVNRNLIEGAGDNDTCLDAVAAEQTTNNTDNLTVQNNVIRGLRKCTTGSPMAISLAQGNNSSVVNNEIYDWCEHAVQAGYNSLPALSNITVENNDIYITSAAVDQYGNAAMGGGVELKIASPSSNPSRVIHNRFWNKRPQSSILCGDSVGSGAAVNFIVSTYVSVQNNIVTDSWMLVGAYNPSAYHNSVIGNLAYNIGPMGSTDSSATIDFDQGFNQEAYLNTIIKATHGTNPYVIGGWKTNEDTQCNVLIDSDGSTTSADSTNIMDHNVFYNTSETTFNGTNTNITKPLTTIAGSLCTTANCLATANTTGKATGDIVRTTSGTPSSCSSATDQNCFLYKVTQVGNTGQVQAIRGPYSFYRKLRTSPERIFIPYATPFSSAPEQGFCPSTTGTRAGIGISDTSIF